jgi:hypothetical protein
VTITYPDGTVIEAIVLSHDDSEVRAIAVGCDDVLAFSRIHGTWISGELEPVAIEFAWQRPRTLTTTSEDACVCPKALAARLIQSLLRGSEPEETKSATVQLFTAGGSRVAVHQTELQLS